MGWAADLDRARASGGQLLTRTSQVNSPIERAGVPVRYVPAAPSSLLERAREIMPSLDLDTYSLARCIASEGYGGPSTGWPAAAVLIGECILNQAKRRELGVTSLLTRSTYGPPLSGHYGEQSGRYASTARDPKNFHALAAEVAKAGAGLAKGAHKFFDPDTQDGGSQGGRQLKDAVYILRAWHGFLHEDPRATDAAIARYKNDRAAWIGPVPSVSSYDLMALREERDADVRHRALEAALAVVEEGRRGRPTVAPGNPDEGFSGAFVVLALAAKGLGFV